MQDLIRRSEAIERDAWLDLYRRAPAPLRERLGLSAVERRGVTLLRASKVDHFLLNRAIGLGTWAVPTPETVDAVVEHFVERSIHRFWIHAGSHLRGSELSRLLTKHGVTRYHRSWMKFVRPRAPLNEVACELTVRRARLEDARKVGHIVAPAFDLPEEAGPLFAAGIGRDGWHYFVAEQRQDVVAVGALYVRGVDACLAFAATAPAARRKGSQRALMAARLKRAQALGCSHAFTETGVPIEGQPGSSYRNMLRAGFDELCERDNFAPEGARWQSQSSSDAIAKSVGSPMRSIRSSKAEARSGT